MIQNFPRSYKPVCGKDGKTYSNQWDLSCNGVEKECEGECQCNETCMCMRFNFLTLQASNVSLFFQARNYFPVCGVDGKTYGNECVARCFGMREKCNGQCPCVKEECLCPRNFDPVCGEDGQAYGNKCLAKCNDVESKCNLLGSGIRDGPCNCEELDSTVFFRCDSISIFDHVCHGHSHSHITFSKYNKEDLYNLLSSTFKHFQALLGTFGYFKVL